jgi:O-antigen/teichoic acid export membrane protein
MILKFLWTISGNFSNALIQMFMLIWITYYIDLESAGKFALAMAIVTPIFNFFGLQIRSVIATDLKQLFRWQHYQSVMAKTNVIAMIISAVCLIFFSFDQDWLVCVLVLGLVKSIENTLDIHYGYYQKQARIHLAGQSLLLSNLSLMLILLLILFFDQITINLTIVACAYLSTRLLIFALNTQISPPL